MVYQPTIGLEIHAELKTKAKMFCGCPNDFKERRSNVNVCPVCLGHPGTLPTINKKAVEAVLKLGMALNSEIFKVSKFDRKNYFYPDLPKGYQISQYDKPLVSGGELNGVKIRRIHLEEDTGKLVHSSDGNSSLVDFNRAGVPLMELVTEPVIKSGKEAVDFAKELRIILKYLGISDADMEKGQMRIEANLSISKDHKLGTKVELKNLNSFRAVEEAIDYEIKRQAEILEKSESVFQETRGWDENKKETFSQRGKEEAHDYRYFPEPDLPPLDISEFDVETIRASLPELPNDKKFRLRRQYGLNENQAGVLAEDRLLAEYFEESVSEITEELHGTEMEKNIQEAVNALYNYLISDARGIMNERKMEMKDLKITPENFADLIVLIVKGGISSRLAKNILKEMFSTGLDPRRVIEEKGLSKISDEETIVKAAKEAIGGNPKAVDDYKKGKEGALQFLVGQVMAKTGGRTDPGEVLKILKDLLTGISK